MVHAHRLAVLLALLTTPACLGSGHSINAYAGIRTLDSDDFENAEVEDQNVLGADAVLGIGRWLGVEGGWFRSDEEKSGVEVELDEYFLGLRLTPWHFLIEPYASAGATYVDADVNTAGDDAGLGFYGRLGAAISVAFLRFGLDGRVAVSEDLDFGTIESDVTNYQLAAFIGVGF